jgi:hypothetical protein
MDLTWLESHESGHARILMQLGIIQYVIPPQRLLKWNVVRRVLHPHKKQVCKWRRWRGTSEKRVRQGTPKLWLSALVPHWGEFKQTFCWWFQLRYVRGWGRRRGRKVTGVLWNQLWHMTLLDHTVLYSKVSVVYCNRGRSKKGMWYHCHIHLQTKLYFFLMPLLIWFDFRIGLLL